MTQWSSTHVAFAEDLGSIPSILMVAHIHNSSLRNPMSSCDLQEHHALTWDSDMQAGKIFTHKINNLI